MDAAVFAVPFDVSDRVSGGVRSIATYRFSLPIPTGAVPGEWKAEIALEASTLDGAPLPLVSPSSVAGGFSVINNGGIDRDLPEVLTIQHQTLVVSSAPRRDQQVCLFPTGSHHLESLDGIALQKVDFTHETITSNTLTQDGWTETPARPIGGGVYRIELPSEEETGFLQLYAEDPNSAPTSE